MMHYTVEIAPGRTELVDEDAVAVAALEAVMRDLSEDCYHAGWMSGLEDELWARCQAEQPDRYGHCDAAEISDRLAALRVLSELAGCWLTWDDGKGDPVPISLREWRRRLGEA